MIVWPGLKRSYTSVVLNYLNELLVRFFKCTLPKRTDVDYKMRNGCNRIPLVIHGENSGKDCYKMASAKSISKSFKNLHKISLSYLLQPLSRWSWFKLRRRQCFFFSQSCHLKALVVFSPHEATTTQQTELLTVLHICHLANVPMQLFKESTTKKIRILIFQYFKHFYVQ